ncbi:hypothetical protein RJ640_001849 [Escallonia rubra]|uniref:CSC1/OSCA1-like N-terminal transmembrane domain-containing protein n=1 Tax=Escallonia rubra TaxID=112253 RepID=A0AA88UWQ8_9ASTE|nr:hypothetical protein RJ640_001849 [Escallonia rubra]
MASLGDIGVSAAINILGAFAFLLAFALLRIQPINDRVYFPKWYISGGRTSPRNTGNFVGKFVNLNFKTYLTFLNWMPQAMKMSEAEIIDHAGLDSAVFLRIYILGHNYRNAVWQKYNVLLFAAVQSTATGVLHAFGRVLLLDCSPAGKEGIFSAWFSWVRAIGTGFAVSSAGPANISRSFGVAFCTAIVGIVVLIFGNISNFGGAVAAGDLRDRSEKNSPVHGLDQSVDVKAAHEGGAEIDWGFRDDIVMGRIRFFLEIRRPKTDKVRFVARIGKKPRVKFPLSETSWLVELSSSPALIVVTAPALWWLNKNAQKKKKKTSNCMMSLLSMEETTGMHSHNYRNAVWQKYNVLLFAAARSTATGVLHAFGRVLLLDCSPAGKEGIFSAWFSWVRAIGSCAGFAVASAGPANISRSFGVAFCTAIVGIVVLIFGNISNFGGAVAAGDLRDRSEKNSPVHGLDQSVDIDWGFRDDIVMGRIRPHNAACSVAITEKSNTIATVPAPFHAVAKTQA